MYEVEGVYRALDAGRMECEEMTWQDSMSIAQLMDRALESLGVKYPADDA